MPATLPYRVSRVYRIGKADTTVGGNAAFDCFNGATTCAWRNRINTPEYENARRNRNLPLLPIGLSSQNLFPYILLTCFSDRWNHYVQNIIQLSRLFMTDDEWFQPHCSHLKARYSHGSLAIEEINLSQAHYGRDFQCYGIIFYRISQAQFVMNSMKIISLRYLRKGNECNIEIVGKLFVRIELVGFRWRGEKTLRCAMSSFFCGSEYSWIVLLNAWLLRRYIRTFALVK